MKKKEALEIYLKEVGEPFPESYFEFMESLEFEGYSEDNVIEVAIACSEVGVKYEIDPSFEMQYQIYVAESDYKEKFGTEAPSLYVSEEEWLTLLTDAIKTGKQVEPNEENILF